MTAAPSQLDAAAALRSALAALQSFREQADALDATETKLQGVIAAAETSGDVENMALAADAAAAQIRLRMAANRRQQLAAELLAARRTVADTLAGFHSAMLAAADDTKGELLADVASRLQNTGLDLADVQAAAVLVLPRTGRGRELERITASLVQLGDALDDCERQGDTAAALLQAADDLNTLRGLTPALERKNELEPKSESTTDAGRTGEETTRHV
jgi:hypothetical protein